jgi:hypothetical protein
VREELKKPIINKRATVNAPPLAEKPIPFDITEHGKRFRRQTLHPHCTGDQYILFVLDTSGSVGKANFDKVTSVLSELVLFFCSPIKIAVMTFDHEYFAEFCFDCFDNSCGGRVDARQAFLDIDYKYDRTGTRWTHTAGAAQCACDFMLTSTCGLPPDAGCIDVVFITDGRSNDPHLDVCQEVRCLHRRYGTTTFALGIGHPNPAELECISDADENTFHIFNFQNFDKFELVFLELVDKLLQGQIAPSGDPYVCIGTQGVGTAGCHK